MLAINRKYIGNNVYLSSYTRLQINSNGNNHVLGVGLHDYKNSNNNNFPRHDESTENQTSEEIQSACMKPAKLVAITEGGLFTDTGVNERGENE